MISAEITRADGKGFTSLILRGEDAFAYLCKARELLGDQPFICFPVHQGFQIILHGQKKPLHDVLENICESLGLAV